MNKQEGCKDYGKNNTISNNKKQQGGSNVKSSTKKNYREW
jgi:hypothetical protein